MERYVICVIFVFFSLTQAKQFRLDYKYNSGTDAFYKLHVNTTDQSSAQETCRRESAQLMIVSSNVDVAQAISMFEHYPELKYAWVENDGRYSEKLEDEYECKVVTNTWKVQSHNCYQNLPFICKVNANDVKYDSEECQVFSQDYKYFANISSCYRVSRTALTWDQANDECNAEGAHLVIINSKAENDIVWNIIKNEPKVYSSNFWWFYFAGFRANNPNDGTRRVFRTVLNQTLEEIGYVNWGQYEPNNSKGVEYCGSIYKDEGTFNDVNCIYELPFICEKEIVPNNS